MPNIFGTSEAIVVGAGTVVRPPVAPVIFVPSGYVDDFNRTVPNNTPFVTPGFTTFSWGYANNWPVNGTTAGLWDFFPNECSAISCDGANALATMDTGLNSPQTHAFIDFGTGYLVVNDNADWLMTVRFQFTFVPTTTLTSWIQVGLGGYEELNIILSTLSGDPGVGGNIHGGIYFSFGNVPYYSHSITSWTANTWYRADVYYTTANDTIRARVYLDSGAVPAFQIFDDTGQGHPTGSTSAGIIMTDTRGVGGSPQTFTFDYMHSTTQTLSGSTVGFLLSYGDDDLSTSWKIQSIGIQQNITGAALEQDCRESGSTANLIAVFDSWVVPSNATRAHVVGTFYFDAATGETGTWSGHLVAGYWGTGTPGFGQAHLTNLVTVTTLQDYSTHGTFQTFACDVTCQPGSYLQLFIDGALVSPGGTTNASAVTIPTVNRGGAVDFGLQFYTV